MQLYTCTGMEKNIIADTPDYPLLAKSLAALLEGERDFVANAANFSAFVFNGLPKLNWAGFYMLRGEELVLGPFQGKPACVRLKKPRGVCWASALKGETVVVDDVHCFDGHIACDSNSVSELVLPVKRNGEVVAVFDVDSPVSSRFGKEDRAGFEKLVSVFETSADLSRL